MQEPSYMVYRTALLSVIVLLLILPGSGACQETDRPMAPVPGAIGHKVKVRTKPFTIRFSPVDSKDAYKIGEKVRFEFETDRDCVLYLVDIGSSGRVHLLFPNKLDSSNTFEGGKLHTLPAKNSKMEFRVHGPEGTNRVKAIAVIQGPASDGLRDHLPDPSSEGSETAELAAKKLEAALEESDRKNWRETIVSFQVVK